MQKFIILFLLAYVSFSCSDEIESNSPSVQGEVDGVFFKANTSSAVLNPNNSLTIKGTTAFEEVTLKVANMQEGTYTLGENTQNEATFTNNDQVLFTTGSTGFGEINITKVEGNTVSGEFFFDAYSATGDTLNFNKGYFFFVPVGGNLPDEEEDPTCEEATEEAEAAQLIYEEANPENPEEFVLACNAYKEALQQQKEICGDENEEIQAQIDALGDCEGEADNNDVGTISLTAGTQEIEFDVVEVVNVDGMVQVSGETSAENLYTIYFEVPEAEEGEALLQNFEVSLTSTFYPSDMEAPNNFVNTVETNTATNLIGTFSGVVVNDDNGQLEITNGNFELSY